MSEKSKRILILTTAYKPLVGGSEKAIEEVTGRLSDCHFDLVTGRPSRRTPAYEEIANMHIFRVGGFLIRLNLFLPKLLLPLAIFLKARYLTEHHHYDAIHVFQASQAGGAAWLLKFFYSQLPLIVTLQEGKELDRQGWLVRTLRALIVRKADKATAISRYLSDYLHGLRSDLPVTVIPNGVDLKNFSQSFSYGELSKLSDRLGIRPGTKVIISVSRLAFKNGLDNLIRAAALLAKNHPQLEWKLLLVGSGELKAELLLLTHELEIKERVVFVNTVDHFHLPLYLKLAHVFVRPSRSEGLGSAFLEAMAAGVPVVAPAVGGITDFLVDEQTGLVCEPFNPADIAQKIARLLLDEELRKKLAQNGLTLVRSAYNWDNLASEYRKLY